MTPSDIQLLISSHGGVTWYSCSAWSTSFTPMNARMIASPCDRYTSLLTSPPSRKYNCRRPISAKALAVKTRNASCVIPRSEEHTSELQSRENLVCRLLLEKKK